MFSRNWVAKVVRHQSLKTNCAKSFIATSLSSDLGSGNSAEWKMGFARGLIGRLELCRSALIKQRCCRTQIAKFWIFQVENSAVIAVKNEKRANEARVIIANLRLQLGHGGFHGKIALVPTMGLPSLASLCFVSPFDYLNGERFNRCESPKLIIEGYNVRMILRARVSNMTIIISTWRSKRKQFWSLTMTVWLGTMTLMQLY